VVFRRQNLITVVKGHYQKRGVLRCNGTRRVTIKTLHGAFAFVVQRFQCPSSGETTYLELTEQLCEGAMSARLAEFSAYYYSVS